MDEKNGELTIEQIKTFIEANRERPDVAEYITSLEVEKPLNVENVSAYLGTIEGKNLIQPILDRFATNAIKTHDEKQKPIIEATVKAKVNEEIQRMNPAETPEQRQIRELRQNQEEMQKQLEKERLDYAITQEYAKRNVPLELAKDVPWPSLEHAVNGAMIWEQVKNKEIEKLVNERMASESFKPLGSREKNDQKIDLSKLSQAELVKMELEGTLDSAMA